MKLTFLSHQQSVLHCIDELEVVESQRHFVFAHTVQFPVITKALLSVFRDTSHQPYVISKVNFTTGEVFSLNFVH
jgi:hypothetical protein